MCLFIRLAQVAITVTNAIDYYEGFYERDRSMSLTTLSRLKSAKSVERTDPPVGLS